MNAPNVHHDARALGDVVAQVLVVLHDGVRRRAQHRRRHPPHRLLDARDHVRQARRVLQLGQAGGADDGVELALGLALRVRVEQHALREAVQRAARRVAAGFEERAGDVGGEVVGEALGQLPPGHVDAELK